MELIFEEHGHSYLRRVLHDTVSQEQTVDVVIPDSLPDAQRVVDAFAVVLLRSASCDAEQAQIGAVATAGVLFVDEAGQVQRLDAQLPFSFRREYPMQEESCELRCRCEIKSVDARLLNSRKLLVRVGLTCTLEVYSVHTRTEYDLPEPAPTLQLLLQELPMRLPMGLGERSFSIHEELELPPEKQPIARPLKTLSRLGVKEERMVGNKAVFKGELLVHLLYENAAGELDTCQWTVPFSQYAELAQELDECAVYTTLTLTALEAEPDSSLESRRLLIGAEVLAQCLAVGEQQVKLISDAFCTDAELTAQWERWTVEATLDSRCLNQTAAAEISAQAQRVVDAWAWPDELLRQRQEGGLRVELPLNCNVLYLDTEGQLQRQTLRPVARFSLEAEEAVSCEKAGLTLGQLQCTAQRGEISLRMPVELSLNSVVQQELSTLCAAELSPPEKQGEKRPAVILRCTQREESVWEIAKALRAPVQGIVDANQLTDGLVPEETLLLIPM